MAAAMRKASAGFPIKIRTGANARLNKSALSENKEEKIMGYFHVSLIKYIAK